MVVRIGGGEVQGHGAGQVDGQLRPGLRIGSLGPGDEPLVGGIDKARDPAVFPRVAGGLGQRILGTVAGDDEGDGAELFGRIEVARLLAQGQQQGGGGAGGGEIRVRIGAAVQQHLAPPRPFLAHLRNKRQRGGRLDRGQDHRGLLRVLDQPGDGLGQPFGHLLAGHGAIGRVHLRREIDGLRRGAHLRRKHAHRGRQRPQRRVQVLCPLQHHGIDARGFGEGQRRMGIRLDPGAEAGGAGEIDDGASGVLDEPLAQRFGQRIDTERQQVRVEPRLRQNPPPGPHRDRHRQHRHRMRLDDHRIAGGQRRQDRRPGVPGGEGRAGKAHRHPARDDAIGLVEGDLGRAEAAFPAGAFGGEAHRGLGMDQHLDPPVQRVHAGPRIGHVERLPGGVHDRLHDLEQVVAVEGIESFQQHAQPRVDIGRSPARHRGAGGGEQGVGVGLRIGDAQRGLGIGRHLLPRLARHARLVQIEGPAALALKPRQPPGLRGLGIRVLARHLGLGRPAGAAGDGALRGLERGAVAVEHQRLQWMRWWRAPSRADSTRSAPVRAMSRTCSVPTKAGFSAWVTRCTTRGPSMIS